MKLKKKDLDVNLRKTRQELRNFRLNAKDCGHIETVQKELARLETVERELASYIPKLEARIANIKTAGYDANSAQRVFQQVNRKLKDLPAQQQIKIIRTLVKSIKVWKDRVELDLNELSEADLKQCLAQRPIA